MVAIKLLDESQLDTACYESHSHFESSKELGAHFTCGHFALIVVVDNNNNGKERLVLACSSANRRLVDVDVDVVAIACDDDSQLAQQRDTQKCSCQKAD